MALFFLSNDLTLSLTIDTIIFNGCAALALMSHFRAMTTGMSYHIAVISICTKSHFSYRSNNLNDVILYTVKLRDKMIAKQS